MRIGRLVFTTSLVAAAGCNLLTGASGLGFDEGEPPVVPPSDPDTGTPIVSLPESGPAPDGAIPPDSGKDARVTDARADSPTDAPVANAKRVFVTTAKTNGDMNGFTKGDQMCADAATAAGLGGTWVAWLSTQVTDAINRVTSAGPWYLVDRLTLAVTGKAQLMTLVITHEINQDENGDPVVNDGVWTGTRNGAFYQFDCNGWNASTPVQGGTIGRTNSNGQSWTRESATGCSTQHRVYCFEN